MKIGDFPLVQRLIAARDELVVKRDHGKLTVAIDLHQQDAELVAACRPVVQAVLQERILELNKDLQALGVQI